MIQPHPDEIRASQDFISELSKSVSEVAFDNITRLLYSTDASIYQMMPVGVAFPRDADEVTAAVECAKRFNIPLLPRGGGSSLAGQAVGHALIIDFSRHMDKVIDINPEQRTVTTQPGITLGNLNKILTKHGFMYGPDPASADRATIGGIIGNNSTGAHSIVYGMTHDHVIETDIVLADGSRANFAAFDNDWEHQGKRSGLEGQIYTGIHKITDKYREHIESGYPNTFRNVAGYNLNLICGNLNPNLASLIVGSEGTLGVITQTRLNLVKIPTKKRLALVHFQNLIESMEAVPHILETNPSAIEVLDKMLLDLTRNRVEYSKLLTFVEGNPEIILVVEYTGETISELDACIEALQIKLQQIHHAGSNIIISDPREQAKVWHIRKLGLGILMSVRGDAKPIPFIEDAAVPVDHLAEYVSTIMQFASSTGIEKVAMYAHASAGCLHIRPLVNLKNNAGVRQLRQVAEKSAELVVKFGGTTSGEHGEGIVRGEFSELLYGKNIVQAFHEVKSVFDANNLLNPGKVVNTPRMDDESLLRYGSNYSTDLSPKPTMFAFEEDQGFPGAVEMCNGAGVCRKIDDGVMCPSFQATRDEIHSTRGRANALRAAMTGKLGPDGMTSKELYDVLDLCLSCHACLSECPSSVDMAKLKAEFLYHYQSKHGIPLRSRFFANIENMERLGHPFAPLINKFFGGPGKQILNFLGIHPDRTLPELSRQTFTNTYKRRNNGAHANLVKAENQVVFFHDTMMEYHQPEIGIAAINVLVASGFEPIVLDSKRDSGRPALSKGLINKAKRLALHNINLLAPYAEAGIPIVGCEPSSMVMLVHEYPDLVPGRKAQLVAKQATMIDRFIIEKHDEGKLHLRFDQTPRQILFHGHCQQKAVFGIESVIRMLELIPNCVVEEIESGCCGMAGSFGYETEHYDLSIKLAEMNLAPSVRAAAKEVIVSAMGTSCREQITHTTRRKSHHPIEIFEESLLR